MDNRIYTLLWNSLLDNVSSENNEKAAFTITKKKTLKNVLLCNSSYNI